MFANITVVAIDGAGNIESHIPSILKTSLGLPGSKKLLITNRLIDSDMPQKVIAQALDYGGYSDFVIYCIFQYIDTDFVLIVQNDGWMLNAQNWRNEWYEYDYIGGLTHAAIVGSEFYRNYQWKDKPNPIIVQNGGFSLRSRKLLEAPTKYGIVKHPQIGDLANEDVQLSCLMRPALESVGLKFATDEESKLFSFEHLDDEIHKDLDLRKVFGHHSKTRRLTSNETVNWSCDIYNDGGESEIKIQELFLDYGYKIVLA